ncbi:hypothetical protein G7054_g10441 [Neopestalotiopsis clavispora]|nr:hypothetical protein G7054_g10441 [Neopestalotiopsis clavispora]
MGPPPRPEDIAIVGLELAEVLPQTGLPWYRQRHLLHLNLLMLIPLCSGAGLGFDASMMNGLQALDNWKEYFHNPSSSVLGTLNAVVPIASIFSCCIMGPLADRIGRKKVIVIGVIIVICASIIQACSQNMAMFIVARFLVGFGMNTSFLPCPALIGETAYPTHRGKLTNLSFTLFYLGSIISSWTIYGTFRGLSFSTWSWRLPSLLQAAIPAVQIVFIWWLPESPRWLIANKRMEEAKEILVKYHGGNDPDSPLVAFEMAAIERNLGDDHGQEAVGISSLWRTAADRKRLFVVCYIALLSNWAGNAVAGYYLSIVLTSIGITDSGTQTLINGILQVYNAVIAWSGALSVDRLGRRTLWITSSIGMFCSYLAWTICAYFNMEKNDVAAGRGVLAFIFIFYFFYDISLSQMTFVGKPFNRNNLVLIETCASGYPAEIMPFHNRQMALNLTIILSNVSLMFNLFVNPIALESITWRYYILYCIILAVSIVVMVLFVPETRGKSLEDISKVFESKKRAWHNDRSPADDEVAMENNCKTKVVMQEHVESTET